MFVSLGKGTLAPYRLLTITSGRKVLPKPPLTPIHFPESTGGRWITWVSMGEEENPPLSGWDLKGSDSRKNLSVCAMNQ